MVEHKFCFVYSTDTTKPLKTKEISFTLFSTVAQLLKYGEIKYSKILLDLEGGEKKRFISEHAKPDTLFKTHQKSRFSKFS